MANVVEYTTQQADAWLSAMEPCVPYDFYHLPQYHALAEQAGEGEARLFVYTEGAHRIVLPLLLRSLDGLAVSAAIGTGWRDATSVYGYPGPLASPAPIPGEVVCGFQAALTHRLRELHVVTVFSRLHPLLDQLPLLKGLGEFPTSQTVSIDLTLPLPIQRSRYRKSFKEAINKLRRLGLTVVRDADGSYFDAFLAIYHETMCRVEAADRYHFPARYFTGLREALGSRLDLFTCLHEGKPVCAGLFVTCHGMVQYHLGGTLDAALQLAPMKLLIDEVRLWGTAQGSRVFHLGGGTSANPDDPLLYFKRGFSDRQHAFATWRWILMPEPEGRLREENARNLASQGQRPAVCNYFPEYRCPGAPPEPVAAAPAGGETPVEPVLTVGTP